MTSRFRALRALALRIDGKTMAYDQVTGLVEPYTYSDMTGFGLANTVKPPPG